MIDENGKRVAGPKAPDIPPHMLAGMTSAGQKRVLSRYTRTESRPATKKATTKTAKKVGTKTSTQQASPRKRTAKKAAPAPTEHKASAAAE